MSDPDPREETIFAAALALPAEARNAYLDAACAGHPERRAHVENLLQAHDLAQSFMKVSPAEEIAPERTMDVPRPDGAGEHIGRYKLLQKIGEGAALPADVSAEGSAKADLPAIALAKADPSAPSAKEDLSAVASQGNRIGRYKLLQKLGEGGCGVVYMAEQEEPVRRRVALKVIKLGMDTKEVIARFEAERQALALMDHSNIAKVLDAGATEAGRPFFVMELVRGITITKYCDEQNLPTRARLELFMQVCHAVQHAHQKGIIHRDIKPSNILVTLHDGKPVPKIIDFGIAKATAGRLTDHTLFTAFEQFIGTPAYMSPEQAEMSGLDIDTRSDIYSLGVLLYELLTGRPPFDPKSLVSAGLDEIRRIIREVDPPRMSTRLSTLSDLDRATIAKQRAIAPAHLSTLLRGDLDWIVMRCLEKDRTRRYETANSLALDVLRHLHDEPVVARPASAAYRVRKFVRRNQLAVAAGLAVLLAVVLGGIISAWQAVRATRAERVAVASRQQAETAQTNEARLRTVAENNAKQAQTEAARSKQVARFMSNLLAGIGPSVARGRDTQLLREIIDQNVDRLAKDLAGQPEVEADLRQTLGVAYLNLGENAKADATLRESLRLRTDALGPDHPKTLAAMVGLAATYLERGRPEMAEPLFSKSLEIRRRVFGDAHPGTLNDMNSLAVLYRSQNRLDETERLHVERYEITRRVHGEDHMDTVKAMTGLGLLYRDRNRPADAEPLLKKSLEIRRRILGEADQETRNMLVGLANFYRREKRYGEAEALYLENLDFARRTQGEEHFNTLLTENNLALLYRDQGRLAEAERLLQRVVEVARRKPEIDPLYSTEWVLNLAALYERNNEWAKAEPFHRDLLERRRRLLPAGSVQIGASVQRVGRNLLDQKRPAEAEPLLREAVAIFDQQRHTDAFSALAARGLLGASLQAQRRFAEAETLLVASFEGFQRLTAEPRARDLLKDVGTRLVRMYTEWDRPESAAEWQRKVAALEPPTTGQGVAPTKLPEAKPR